MTLWNKTGKLPQDLNRAEKRNVVATAEGYVRRQVKTDVNNNVRIIDQVLVAIGGLANSSNMGSPSITDVWHVPATIAAGNAASVVTYVSFDEPVKFDGASGTIAMTIANTAGGATVTAVSNTSVAGSNNTIAFTWIAETAGTYKVQAQTLANSSSTAVALKSLNAGNEAASLVVSGTVSNTSGDFIAS